MSSDNDSAHFEGPPHPGVSAGHYRHVGFLPAGRMPLVPFHLLVLLALARAAHLLRLSAPVFRGVQRVSLRYLPFEARVLVQLSN